MAPAVCRIAGAGSRRWAQLDWHSSDGLEAVLLLPQRPPVVEERLDGPPQRDPADDELALDHHDVVRAGSSGSAFRLRQVDDQSRGLADADRAHGVVDVASGGRLQVLRAERHGIEALDQLAYLAQTHLEQPIVAFAKVDRRPRGTRVSHAGSVASGAGRPFRRAVPLRRDVVADRGALEFSVAVGAGTEGADPATSSLVAIDIVRQRNGRLPDLLVSGINDGANIGAFTQVSGTIGAAVVALASTFNGTVPAIAVSTDAICTEATPECQGRNAAHFERVARFVIEVIAQLEQKSGPLGGEPGPDFRPAYDPLLACRPNGAGAAASARVRCR